MGGISTDPANKAFGILNALGSVAFAYTFSLILVEIQDTIRQPPSAVTVMKKACNWAITLSFVFYFVIAVGGYASLGNDTPGMVLEGFPEAPEGVLIAANVAILVRSGLAPPRRLPGLLGLLGLLARTSAASAGRPPRTAAGLPRVLTPAARPSPRLQLHMLAAFQTYGQPMYDTLESWIKHAMIKKARKARKNSEGSISDNASDVSKSEMKSEWRRQGRGCAGRCEAACWAVLPSRALATECLLPSTAPVLPACSQPSCTACPLPSAALPAHGIDAQREAQVHNTAPHAAVPPTAAQLAHPEGAIVHKVQEYADATAMFHMDTVSRWGPACWACCALLGCLLGWRSRWRLSRGAPAARPGSAPPRPSCPVPHSPRRTLHPP